MKIFVMLKTNARSEEVKDLGSSYYSVAVNAPPREGKANKRAVELLAEHFGVAQSRIVLVSGHTSKQKIFEIKNI